ncbi:hypothetical protein RIF29_20368 [Crotalaria pallida]|uniref:Uncharacterized protein n=1 Tax=Crotalaria pallida TaxID=3830 RepID=A0AAN9F5H2_CROPI
MSYCRRQRSYKLVVTKAQALNFSFHHTPFTSSHSRNLILPALSLSLSLSLSSHLSSSISPLNMAAAGVPRSLRRRAVASASFSAFRSLTSLSHFSMFSIFVCYLWQWWWLLLFP